jgi:leucine-rich repeat kinase 1
MTEGEKGIDYLRPWLLNVQSRAPKSPVIIVGTHLDKIPSNQVNELRQLYKSKILDSYGSQGYPTIHDICMVSCVTHAGIKELQDRIHSAAISAKDPDTHEYVIGMQVPASYILLQNMIEDEAKKLKDSEHPPVLNQKEFAALAEKTNDIADPEELTLAAQFLHDNGIILHYNDHLKGLNNLYFIDSVWLADMLAHIITVPQRQNFAHNGLLMETHLKFIFRDNKNYPVQYLPQYMQLLERFEIALSLGQGTLLIPSMLPEQRPALPFAMPLPKTKRQPNPEPRVIRKDTLMKGCSSTDVENQPEEEEEDEESITKMVDGKLVANNKVTCVRRRYKMAYIPSGFWSRLISRLMINLKRSGLVDYKTPHVLSDPNIIYWRRGILIIYATGRFLVEAIQSPLSG